VLAVHVREQAQMLEGLAAFVHSCPNLTSGYSCWAPWPSAMASSCQVAPPSTPC
jgi:hypothetical protein